MTLLAGTRLGAYEILVPLGAGGMGEVYRARDTRLKRDVAIKVLPSSLARDPDALARFEREAIAVATLSHANILAIHDFGREGDQTYAVTELLEGETLRARIERSLLSRREILDYSIQLARGLTAAHEKGIVHRDLKPENVFVTTSGQVKILDFGLAKKIEPISPSEVTNAPTGSLHTVPGTLLGTVGYMSPEQIRGLPVDGRTDIFSFGSILYELMSGKKAFQRSTGADTLAAILGEDPELPVSGGRSDPELERILRGCLAKDVARRLQSAQDLLFALETGSLGASPLREATPCR